MTNTLNTLVSLLPSSGYKMGDKKVITYRGVEYVGDQREYYSGRGAKYNSSIKHGYIHLQLADGIDINQIVFYLNYNGTPSAAFMILKQITKKIFKVQSLTRTGFDGPIEYYTPEFGTYYAESFDKLKSVMALKKEQAIHQKKMTSKKYRAQFAAKQAVEQVHVMGQPHCKDADGNPILFNDQRDIYSGCGVYRVGWRNGKMTCALYNGFHDSCPTGLAQDEWLTAVTAEMKKHADHIVKMDGSGCQFFFRDMEDADLVTNATEVYFVPDSRGGLHLNIQPAEAEIVQPKQLTNG